MVQQIVSADNRTVAQTTDHMKGALVTGAFISVLVTPMEGVKARLQVQYSATTTPTGNVFVYRKVESYRKIKEDGDKERLKKVTIKRGNKNVNTCVNSSCV